MPFLRFTCDGRGYEHTYLLHQVRHRGKARPRILYWFRTPPHVRVGRSALDQEAIRSIEEHHPDLQFDWTKILVAPPAPASQAGAEGRRRRRSARGVPESSRERTSTEAQAPKSTPGESGDLPRVASAALAVPEAAARPFDLGMGERPAVTPPAERDEIAQIPKHLPGDTTADTSPARGIDEEDLACVPEPEAGDEAVDEAMMLERAAEAEDSRSSLDHTTAIESLVGGEGLALLRARFAAVQARITAHGGDAAEMEALRVQAERLNPDAWVTAEEARRGLEEFESVLEGLRQALGRRRRRSSRGRRHPRSQPPPDGSAPPPTGSES